MAARTDKDHTDDGRADDRPMKFGITMFPTEYAVGVVALGEMVEDRGFESIFLPEHTHVPAARATPYPSTGGLELPEEFFHIQDPFVCLAAIAARTETLRLATGVTLVPERDPILLAKAVSTLDQISGGRVTVGVGAGWNREELESHGYPEESRWRRFREGIEAMRTIWTEEKASYRGEIFSFDEIYQWPKPVQQPHPPVLIGGTGPTVHERVVELGDGWLASGRHLDGEELAERIAHLRDFSPRPVEVSLQEATPELDALRHYEEMGLDRAIFRVQPEGREAVEAQLDAYAGLVDQFRRAAS